MSTLQNLVAACQADETQLRQQAQSRMENWQPWLVPVSDASLTGEDPGYTMIFSVSGRRSINFPASIPG